MSKNNPALTLFTTGTANPNAPASRDIPIDPWHAILLCVFVLVAVVVGYMIRHNILQERHNSALELDRRRRAQELERGSESQSTSQRLREATATLNAKMHARRSTTADAPTMPMDYSARPSNTDVWSDVVKPRA